MKLGNVELRPGMVIVTEGGDNFTGKFLKWAQRSRFTHVVLMINENEFVEADALKHVRFGRIQDRLVELEAQGRAYVVLDHPSLTEDARKLIAMEAVTYVGRKYDYLKAVQWFFTRRFYSDGPLRLICSRLVTAAYDRGLGGWTCFNPTKTRFLSNSHQKDLWEGYCVPTEFLLYGDFRIVYEKW